MPSGRPPPGFLQGVIPPDAFHETPGRRTIAYRPPFIGNKLLLSISGILAIWSKGTTAIT